MQYGVRMVDIMAYGQRAPARHAKNGFTSGSWWCCRRIRPRNNRWFPARYANANPVLWGSRSILWANARIHGDCPRRSGSGVALQPCILFGDGFWSIRRCAACLWRADWSLADNERSPGALRLGRRRSRDCSVGGIPTKQCRFHHQLASLTKLRGLLHRDDEN